MSTPQAKRSGPARLATDLLNPFFIFTALYVAVAFAEGGPSEALLYTLPEVVAAGLVAGYVLLMRRSRRVSDFWISARAERLVPAIVLLSAFVGLLLALALMRAPQPLILLTLSMGLAAATVAALTLYWKASAHSAVAGHAAAAGVLLLGAWGLVFVLALPLVLWARVSLRAHTPAQALAGAGVGAFFALPFLA